MIVAERSIEAPNPSVAWADALALLLDTKPHRTTNLTLRIADPLAEDIQIRSQADDMLKGLGMQDITEVANTIFPAEWALDFPDPVELAADYREVYPFLKSLGNKTGTYFGRIVAYPDPAGEETIDQLNANIEKLLKAQSENRVYKSVYEINIYSAVRDRNKKRGFPCMAHIGLHVGSDERLNATAHYRSHDVVAKGYGNYLGLGGLLGYVAQATKREPGELLVVAGGAFLSGSIRRLNAARKEIEALPDSGD